MGEWRNTACHSFKIKSNLDSWLPRNELPWLQKARNAERYTDFYDKETRQIAGERFRQDIDMFGYEFGTA